MTRAARRWLALGAICAAVAAGCSPDTGVRDGVAAVREHPLVVDAYVVGDWIDGDVAYVLVSNEATNEEARTVWCDAMIPNGLIGREMPVNLETLDQMHYWNMPKDCANKKDVPRRRGDL